MSASLRHPSRERRIGERRVTFEAHARLARVAQRPVRIALMGEFSAGKSTLLNLLVGRDVAPTQVVATHVPSLWLHAQDSPDELLFADGRRGPVGSDWQASADLDDAVAVRLGGFDDLPGGCEFIDTPGISDPLLAADALEWAERRADIALWCTPAPQAWRQSEKVAWLARIPRLQKRSLLVVTQADRLSPNDVSRVLKRLEGEAGAYFKGIFPLAAPIADSADDGWSRSGAAALVAALNAGMDEVRAERAALFDRYLAIPPERAQLASVLHATEDGEAQPTAAGAGTSAEGAAATPANVPAGEALALWDRVAADAPPDAAPSRVVDRFLSAIADAHPTSSPEAAPWFALLRSATDADAGRRDLVLNQLRGEIADFAESAWCDLAAA